MYRKFSKNKILKAASFIAVMLIVYFSLANKLIIYAKLNDLKLIPIQESFTELYFTNHHNLPSQIRLNEKQYFSFTIRNLENKDLDYKYVVFLSYPDNQEIVDSKTIYLKNGESLNINEAFLINKSTSKATVSVRLSKFNQEIRFLLTGPT